MKRNSLIIAVLFTGLATAASAGGVDELGRTPLHIAAAQGQAAKIPALLAAGQDVNAVTNAGDTALHIAARRVDVDAITVLLAAGADPTRANAAGQTPLHVLGVSLREGFADPAVILETAAARLIAAGADPAIIANGYPSLVATPAGTSDAGTRDTWTDYSEIGPTLLNYENTYPTLCKRYDLGMSYNGRHLWAIKISDNIATEEDEPEFAYISTMHGDEIIGVKMCMLLIDDLLTNYGTDPQVTALVDDVEIWIVPLMNPDGYDRTTRTRNNAQGYDLNRSFPDLGESNDPSGYPTEVGLLMNWHGGQSITLAANFHGGALVANYPFDNEDSGSRYSDYQDLMVDISETYSILNPPMWNSSSFYHGITNGADWYIIDGGMQDYAWHFHGCTEVTIELGTKQPSASTIGQYWSDNHDAMLAYMEKCLIGVRGIVTDAMTGDPVAATVTVVGRYQNLHTDPDVGDYHRMLLPGTYDLRFEADGYDPLVVTDVVVSSGAATRLDVQLGQPAALQSPNGGEQLTVGVPATIQWTGSPAAQYQVQYTDNYGDIAVSTDDFERSSLGADYTVGGNQPWITTTTDAHGGARSAANGNISDNQISWMTRTVGAGDLSFWYRVSSESGYDYFNFYIDGVRQLHVAGLGSWTFYSTTLGAGSHELKWEYDKDVSVSSGSDTVWIDDLQINDDNTLWHDVAALTGVGDQSVSWTPPAEGDTYRARVRAVYDGGIYGAWDVSDADFAVVVGSLLVGDCNCDGLVNFGDIDPFVSAITDAAGYAAAYPGCDIDAADINGDGLVNYGDIDPFVGLISD